MPLPPESIPGRGEGASAPEEPQVRRMAYFLSDLHLGAPYFSDPHEAERQVVRFLESIRSDAAEIWLLGDILDYWYEYRYVVPRGYVRFFGKLAELADTGIKITWMIGNHDIWIFDYLPKELGITVEDGVIERDILGTRFVLSHGDGIPPLPPTFRILRKLFRNRLCQRLYGAINPRWTIPFARRWSGYSRTTGNSVCVGKESILKNLQNFSLAYSADHPDVRYYIFGHLHTLHRQSLDDSSLHNQANKEKDSSLTAPDNTNSPELIVLGDWLSLNTYASFDGHHLTLHHFQ